MWDWFLIWLLRIIAISIFILICLVSGFSLPDVIRDGLGAQREHKCKPELQLVRSDKVAFTSYNKGASGYIEAGGRGLTNLVCVNPVDFRDNFCVPRARVANFKDGRLIQGNWGDRLVCFGVLNNHDCRTWHVRVHEEVTLVQVTLN